MKKGEKISIAAGILLGLVIVGIFIVLDIGPMEMIVFGLSIVISLFFIINIHEFGHYVFGKIAGYKLISFTIGPLCWKMENERFKFMILKPKDYGGFCAMIPPKEEIEQYRHTIYYMGGILFNFISAIIGILISFYIDGNIQVFLIAFSLTSFFTGVLNALPIMSGNNPSDGMIVWSIILKKPFANDLLKLNRLSAQVSHGVRPKDIEVEFDSEGEMNFTKVYFLFYSYFKALDSKNYSEVDYYIGLLEKNIDKIPEPMLPGIYYEICFNYSIKEDKVNSEKNYKNAGNVLQKDMDLNGLRVKSYYEYYTNKNTQKALEYANEALKVADKFPLKGQAIMEKELVKELIDKIS
ncbi:site-2 protease family protein [Intestinibacter sp.]|uniref:site-2 protease family protein n=1 Tax=Intestinibacter sp. TaxID=1965304 RepID=UPI002A75A2C7|nr:site-2 protease family protein [Intestinibacter sp.]MDY2734443.1 site-2 protease family protein [Intestinibacter sp.]MDY4575363.1 site-2 protease family protein [Intestinibacter sp.]